MTADLMDQKVRLQTALSWVVGAGTIIALLAWTSHEIRIGKLESGETTPMAKTTAIKFQQVERNPMDSVLPGRPVHVQGREEWHLPRRARRRKRGDMDQQPDTIGIIAGGIIAGVAAVVAMFRRLGWKIFGPPARLEDQVDKISATLEAHSVETRKGFEAMNRSLGEIAVQNGRFEERMAAMDRRIEALERK